MDRSRVRGPYARFCERDEVSYGLLTSPYSIFTVFPAPSSDRICHALESYLWTGQSVRVGQRAFAGQIGDKVLGLFASREDRLCLFRGGWC